VTSPTFVIVTEYEGRLPVHHIDAYRLARPSDIVDLGSRELFFCDAVSIIEWADRIAGALPDERLDVTLTLAGESERRLEIAPRGCLYEKLPAGLREALEKAPSAPST
jgi:tRNA threonylcarbamoyladenosine biosynthesis protein TsaE